MCVHCGCGEESNRHGNKNSITIGDVKQAMQVRAHKEGENVGSRSKTAREMKRMVKTK
jgi:hypothetical protein